MSDTIHVYILRCADGSYYIGLTEDLEGRENAHNNGRGSTYTFLRRPVRLVYSESYDSLEKAVGRERQLKRWSRTKKKALIVGDAATLKQLSKRRS
ncbi:MAG: GIY-YIG nuclease family protein [candidate division NC10 bacterium]|jgi:predicted GIY-YIG superfamily endonuclease|nr:GIY-YIG nuclease family protein [candidate division NC10 bacterium]